MKGGQEGEEAPHVTSMRWILAKTLSHVSMSFYVWSDLGNVKHTNMFAVYLFSCDLPIAYYEILSGNL